MTVNNSKVVFKFTKEDVKALSQLADMIYEECGGAVKFSDIIWDVTKEDPKYRTYDFTRFDTFSIEVER